MAAFINHKTGNTLVVTDPAVVSLMTQSDQYSPVVPEVKKSSKKNE
jgi:hypothetical protein